MQAIISIFADEGDKIRYVLLSLSLSRVTPIHPFIHSFSVAWGRPSSPLLSLTAPERRKEKKGLTIGLGDSAR